MNTSFPFNKMCRLCACEKPKASVNMFSDVGKRHLLPDKIRLCLPITVDEDDKLPKEICIACLYKLDMCNELYNTSFTAQNILKSKLQNILYEQPQFLKGDCSEKNSVGCRDSEVENVQPECSSESRLSSNKVQRDSNLIESDLHEPPNSSVISQEVAIRLTSVEPHSVHQHSSSNLFSFETPMDMDDEIPGIIVTDITGAPLAPLHPEDKDMFLSPPPDQNLNDDVDEVAVKVENSSERLVDDKDNEADVSQETFKIQKQKTARANLKPVGKKKLSGNVKCKICQKWFSKSIFSYHKRLHLNERVYSCVDCGKNFKSEESLSSHSCGGT